MSQKTTIVLFSLATASLDGDVGAVANNTAKADRKKGSVPFIFFFDKKNIFNFSKWDLEFQKEGGVGGFSGAAGSWTLSLEGTNAQSLSDTHGWALNSGAGFNIKNALAGDVGYIYSPLYEGVYFGIGISGGPSRFVKYAIPTKTVPY